MSEIGYQVGDALASWGALSVDGETNPDLVWPKSVRVFDKMRREDAQVGSVLKAVTYPIRSAGWMVDAGDARPEVVEMIARDLGLPVRGADPDSVRRNARFSWEEHLRHALLMLPLGHSFFEQVYEERDGLMRLRKLAWRPPGSISRVKVARDGGLLGIEQFGVDSMISVDRLVAYVHEREGGNWLGQSLLRTAYKNWLLKDRMLRAQALTVERNGLGVPVYEAAPAPAGMHGEELRKWQESEKAAGLKIAKAFRSGETAGASIPAGAKLTLTGVTGDLPDTDGPIRYYDEQIARAVLAHFLNLGTETGSWALGSTFASFFTASLNTVAKHVQDVTQQHVIDDLVRVNFGDGEPSPRLVVETIGDKNPVTAESIKSLIDSKAVTPDEALEADIRERFDLPAKQPGAEPEALTPEAAERAALVAQKVYLSVGRVLTTEEARKIVTAAGARLDGMGPTKSEEYV